MNFVHSLLASLLFVTECISQDPNINFLSGNIINKTKLPSIVDIKRFAFYAASAVCNSTQLQDWNCVSCLKADGRDTTLVKVVEDPVLGTLAYVALIHDKNEIVISFRGGVDIQNALEFLGVVQVPFLPYIPNPLATVHSGILISMNSLIGGVEDTLKSLLSNKTYSSYDIVVAGHSLGSSIASLAFLKIQHDFKLDWSRLSLYTYGQLRTGNLAFADYYDSLPITVSRGVNYNDIAPHIFTGIFFAHHQNEFWINNANGTSFTVCNRQVVEDPKCSNSIPISDYSSDSHVVFFDTHFASTLAC